MHFRASPEAHGLHQVFTIQERRKRMLRKVLVMLGLAVLVISAGCSSSPVTPDKSADMIDFFNSFDLSNPVVAEYTYTDLEGNVLASGYLGRNDDGLYIVDRASQTDIDATPLGLVNIFITYNNPAGTIPSGPNAGLPFYYIGQTVDYDINIVSFFNQQIGAPGGYGSGPAQLTCEMRYAYIDSNGQVQPGGLMPGAPTYSWSGVVSQGYQFLNDTYYIPGGTIPGLNVTTARLTAPILFGTFDVVFFDGTAGIWDPQ